MALRWKLLGSRKGSAPSSPLLFVMDLGAANYTLRITDMVHCWCESLNRKEIVRKALDLDTSIDPSEDASQMKLFLGKLQAALEGQQGSGLSIGENAEDLLVLKATASLPSPLLPLIWPFNLSLMPQNALSTELIAPCLGTLSHLQTQVSSLIIQLREKDYVIDRLLGKLRSAGIELNSVFPSVPAATKRSKGLSDSSMKNSVNGLKAFDEEAWKASNQSLAEQSTDLSALCRSIFKRDEVEESNLEQLAHPEIELNSERSIQPKDLAEITMLPHFNEKVPSSASSDATDDEEFQKQLTPESPKLKLPTRVELVPPKRDDSQEILLTPDDQSTTDSSDDDLTARSPAQHQLSLNSPKQNLTTQPKKIGTVGGKMKALSPTETDGKPHPTHNLKSPNKIGRIGGLSKQQQSKSEKILQSFKTASTSSTTPPLKAKQRSSSSSSSDNDKRGRPSSIAQPASPSSPRETSEDRADRKRVELKRMLDDKAKAPLRKKRKF